MNVLKDSRKKENTTQHALESQESEGETPVSNPRISELNPKETSRSSSSLREISLRHSHGIRCIPKHITTFDEKYVLRCLELLRNCALRAAASNFASKVHISPDDFTNSHDMAKLHIECPSVNNFQKFGSVDFDTNFGRKNLLEPFYSVSPEKEVTIVDRRNYVPRRGHRRVASVSSTITSCLDKSPSSAFATSFQGMLTCTWKDGLPQYVFSVGGNAEVYIANLSKVMPSNEMGWDYYVYTFRTRKHENESQSVGTMRVSTSITLCSNSSSEVRETRFVLSLPNDDRAGETQISDRNYKKSKKMTSKVARVFRSSHQRSPSKFSGSSAIFEDSPWEPCEELHKSVGAKVEKDYYVPNLEVAAVVVKEACKNRKEDDLGGWGLKFLKKSGKDASLKTILPSECNTGNYGECSMSLDVLVPAGVHGGPRTRVGGPSSLTERWISGGRCDCGGWDIGCPLTVLNVGSSGVNSSPVVDNSSVDLFMQGSKQDDPIFKMTKIHEDLYYVHFRSTLSTLQSFAVAAAMIHSRSPVLRSKVCRT